VPCRYLAVSVLEVVFLRQASIARMLQADATDLARFITALSQDMTVQASTAQVVTKFFAFWDVALTHLASIDVQLKRRPRYAVS